MVDDPAGTEIENVLGTRTAISARTALSASGPAFVYIILESLAEGGVKVGLLRDVATLLAVQTMLGAARTVLETFPVGSHPLGIVFDGANIWVANSSGQSVTKLRASDGAVLGTFPGAKLSAVDGL